VTSVTARTTRNQRQYHADQDAGDDREIEDDLPALDHDVAWPLAEAKAPT
jgi:hypothetical protein